LIRALGRKNGCPRLAAQYPRRRRIVIEFMVELIRADSQ
jgi:hypothetical protein